MLNWVNRIAVINSIKNIPIGAEKGLQAAGKEIGTTVVQSTRQRLYPGHGYRTGALHTGYHYTIEGNKEVTIKVFSNATNAHGQYYSYYVEYRWGGKVAHLEPAVNENLSKIPNIIRSHVNANIKT